VKKKRGKTARKKSLMLFELVPLFPAIKRMSILERRFVPYGCLLIKDEVEL